MSGPFKLKGWSPFTAKTKTISRKEDQPLTEEQRYEQKVKDAGLWSLYQKEGENAFTKERGSYSTTVQNKIDEYGL